MVDNPGTGGGKIRPKRAAVAKKPYSRTPSQRKSLFSRVTDSFKSLLDPITPRWLSKRMADNGESQDPQRIQQPGADFDEPSTSAYYQEPSAQSNNNCKLSPLSRRPMNRTNVASSETTSRQYEATPPSTWSRDAAPKVFASTGKVGFLKHLRTASKRAKIEVESPLPSESSFLRSELKQLSTCDNASVASSSSCSSSLVVLSRKNLSDPDESQKTAQSSSMDSMTSSRASSSRQQLTMGSQKRPRFNPALFGMPALKPSRSPESFQSSFYDGQVRFGGANSSSTSSYFTAPSKIPTVAKVKVRHVNPHAMSGHSSASSRSSTSPASESSIIGMSSTAKKILQTLEKMSTPLNDARRIPTLARTPYYAADRIRRRPATSVSGSSRPPPISSLSTPSAARLRRRRHMPSDNSLLRKDHEKPAPSEEVDCVSKEPGPSEETVRVSSAASVRGLPAPIASLSSSAIMQRLRSSQTSDGGGGKMKSQRKMTSHYSAVQDEEAGDQFQELPDLPDVALQVSSLPSFNFGKSLITSTPAVRPSEKSADSGEKGKQPEFNFASPVIKTTNQEEGTSSVTSPKFQFTSPPSKSSSTGNERDAPRANPANFVVGSKPSSSPLLFVPDPKVVSAVKASKRKPSPLAAPNAEQNSSGLKPAESLKTGSVLDILGSKAKDTQNGNTSGAAAQSLPLPKQAKSGWTCSVCMVPNEDTFDSCEACTTPKPGRANKPPDFCTVAKKTGWDCATCLVPNDADVEKCVACEELRPGSATAAPKAAVTAFKPTNFESQKQAFSFGIPQKTDTAVDDKKTADEASLSAQFKKPKGMWECSACFVPNDRGSVKCVACETARPGSSSSAFSAPKTTFRSKTTQFKFGISSSSHGFSKKPSGWGDTVKKSTPEWECEVCMVPNSDERKTCEACDSPRPGTKKQLNTSFKFGENSSGLFKFGVPDTRQGQPPKDTSTQQKSETALSGASTTKETETVSTTHASAPAKPAFSFGVLSSEAAGTAAAGSAATQPGAPALALSFGVKHPISEGTQQKRDENDQQAKKSLTAVDTTTPSAAFTTTSVGFNGFQSTLKTQPADKPAGGDLKPTGTNLQPPSSGNLLFAGTKTAFGAKATEERQAFPVGIGTSATDAQQQPPPPYQFGDVKTVTKVLTVPDKRPEQPPGPAAASFQFGATKPTTSGVPMFQFSGTSSSANESVTADSAATTGKSLFSFGAAKSSGGEKQPSAFGAASNDASKGFAGFSAGLSATASGSQASETKNTAFAGFGATAPVAQKTGGVFGSSAPASTTPFGGLASTSGAFDAGGNPSGLFGAAAPSSHVASAGSSAVGIFGPGNSAAFGKGQSSDATTSLPKSFNFAPKSVKEAIQAKPSGFQFGSSTAKPNFQFGTGTQQSNSGATFKFGGSDNKTNFDYGKAAGAQQQSNPGATFNFGGSDSKAAFNPAAPSSGGYQFGAPNAAQSNGTFQFGAANSQPVAESKPFLFGASASGNASSAGFNFSGSASATPSLNFGTGQPSTPQSGAGGPALFSFGESTNPFNATRSTTPVHQTSRRKAVPRRKLKK